MNSLEERIGYRFRDPELLALALTHPSLNTGKSNQRLEFLGDAVLGAIVAELLYELYPTASEGELARRHAALVRGETLTEIAHGLNLSESLRTAPGEAIAGRGHASNLEDALEALIGALYLDGGMESAAAFVTPRWKELARHSTTAAKDAKTTLQEWAQGRGLPMPVYALIDMTGPAHAPEFTIEVSVPGYPPQRAQAASKRSAEQLAAKQLLEGLNA